MNFFVKSGKFSSKIRRRIPPDLYRPGRNSPPSSDGPPFCNVVFSCINKRNLLNTETAFVYFLTGQCPDVEKPCLPPSENKILISLIPDFVEQTVSFYQIPGLIQFPHAFTQRIELIYLPVMAA